MKWLSAIKDDERGYFTPASRMLWPWAAVVAAAVAINAAYDVDSVAPKPGTPTMLEYAVAHPTTVVVPAAGFSFAVVGVLAVYWRVRRDE